MSEKLRGSLRWVLVLALGALLIVVAAVLWLPGGPLGGTPQPSDSPIAVSPLSSPEATSVSEPSSDVWSSRATALLWVVLGGFLALSLTFLILRRYRQDG
jgi:hypothetical protein